MIYVAELSTLLTGGLGSDFLPKGTVGKAGSESPTAEKAGKPCFSPGTRVSISTEAM